MNKTGCEIRGLGRVSGLFGFDLLFRRGKNPSQRRKDRRLRQLAAGLIAIFASTAFGIYELTKPNVTDVTGLVFIDGHIRSFSFKDGARGSHLYYIQLWEYPSWFQ